MAFKRLDELRIEDPIIRSYLRREVIKKIGDFSEDEITPYDINVDEEYRPDLLSFRVYETESLRWLPSLLCKTDGETDPLPVGEIIRLPSAKWISERIRHYEADAYLESELEVVRRG